MRVLALAPAEDEMLVAHALQAGAFGFIAKQAKSEEIMRAIRAVNAGQRYLNTDMAQKLAWKRMRSAPESPFDILSTRELQITKMIMSGQKVPAIAVKLCLSSKTVNGYRYRIFRKLNIATDVELALLAMRHGILQAQDDTVE
jgi:DNA-binding NarL/FixJ family response regulator